MASIEKEAREILSRHCDTLNKLTDELRDDLLKLYRSNHTGKHPMCEANFLESCLRALRIMMIIRGRKEREKLANPRLN